MSRDRTRAVVRFFGTFMLAVQLWVLADFIRGARIENDSTSWIDRATLFSRMAWLKAALWQPPRFERYVVVFTVVSVLSALALWTIGVFRWRRGDSERP